METLPFDATQAWQDFRDVQREDQTVLESKLPKYETSTKEESTAPSGETPPVKEPPAPTTHQVKADVEIEPSKTQALVAEQPGLAGDPASVANMETKGNTSRYALLEDEAWWCLNVLIIYHLFPYLSGEGC